MRTEYEPTAVDHLFPAEGWTKSSFSNANGTGCVGFNITPTHVGVRDTNHPEKGTLVFDHQEWDAFLKGVAKGEAKLPA